MRAILLSWLVLVALLAGWTVYSISAQIPLWIAFSVDGLSVVGYLLALWGGGILWGKRL